MPLRDVSDINARLDAVQDLLEHPTFEAEFTKIAKGLPDLERIVSRIHAKNCKVKDFLKVLTVSSHLPQVILCLIPGFYAGLQEPQQWLVTARRHRGHVRVSHNHWSSAFCPQPHAESEAREGDVPNSGRK